MGFRKNFFGVLAFLALAFMCYGFVGSSAVISNVVQTPVATTENLTQQEAEAARNTGLVIGTGLATTTTICVGLPFFILFALLSWRNAAGQRTERRHQEMLEVQRGK
jgi:hypothetical protein